MTSVYRGRAQLVNLCRTLSFVTNLIPFKVFIIETNLADFIDDTVTEVT